MLSKVRALQTDTQTHRQTDICHRTHYHALLADGNQIIESESVKK